MTEKREQILEHLKAFSPRLIRKFGNLSETEWAKQSRCKDWTVKDVISHMTWVFTNYFHIIETAKNGSDIRKNPNISFRQPGKIDGKSMAGRVSEKAIENSSQFTNKELITEFGSKFNTLLNGFDSANNCQWSLKAYHPVNWVSLYGMLLWTMFEATIHAWDALNAVDSKYVVDEDLAPLLPEYFCDTLINRWFKTADPIETSTQILAIDFGTSNGIRISSSKGNLDIEHCAINSLNADTIIQTSPNEFALLITGRKTLSESIKNNFSDITGEQGLINSFSRWFTGS